MASTLALRATSGYDRATVVPPARTRLRRLITGPPDQPGWARPLLWVLLAGTAALYLVDLTNSGYANEFYAAAVKSGAESWRAWLFGALDSANSITVDKPPAALWLMVLSARIFGFSSFSLLLPQALLGVGTVALTAAAVRRWSGPAAGLIAGALVALTPVAALMFRFDNPDALLVFLMLLAAYAVVRAVDSAGLPRPGAVRWLVLAGAALGLAFLTKMGQGLLVVPAFGLVYLVASPARLGRRLLHLLAAVVALVVSAGWYIALIELWPSASRPYIGGSTNNSLWELALGYNGLGRLLGGTGNGGGGGGGGTGFGGTAGVTRLFNTAFGTQISWFLPAALLALVVIAVLAGRRTRTDRLRAGALLWGGWLLLTGVTFSLMSGTIHPYYAVALAPAIGALFGIATVELWRRRDGVAARAVLAVMLTGTATWGASLLQRDASGWHSWLAWVMLAGGLLGGLLLVISTGRLRSLAVAAVLIGALSAGAGSAAFTAATVSTGHQGSTPSAGPAVTTTAGGMGGGPGAQAPGGTRTTEATDGSALTELLDATDTTWSAAVVGDQAAAGYILATDTAVMAVGGWSGSDASPTLAQFQAYVAQGQVSYFIASGQQSGGGMSGGSDSSAAQITAWVEANFTATTVGGVTVYDLTS